MQILWTWCLQAIDIWRLPRWFFTASVITFAVFYIGCSSLCGEGHICLKIATWYQCSLYRVTLQFFFLMVIRARQGMYGRFLLLCTSGINLDLAHLSRSQFSQCVVQSKPWIYLAMPTPLISMALSVRILLWCWSSNAGSKWTHFSSSFLARCHLDHPSLRHL